MEIFILAILFVVIFIWAIGAKMKADRKRDAKIMGAKMAEEADAHNTNSYSYSNVHTNSLSFRGMSEEEREPECVASYSLF